MVNLGPLILGVFIIFVAIWPCTFANHDICEPVKTAHQQCRDLQFDGACAIEPKREWHRMGCQRLICARKVGDFYLERGIPIAPANGTPCGKRPGQVCINKRCVFIRQPISYEGTSMYYSCVLEA